MTVVVPVMGTADALTPESPNKVFCMLVWDNGMGFYWVPVKSFPKSQRHLLTQDGLKIEGKFSKSSKKLNRGRKRMRVVGKL